MHEKLFQSLPESNESEHDKLVRNILETCLHFNVMFRELSKVNNTHDSFIPGNRKSAY